MGEVPSTNDDGSENSKKKKANDPYSQEIAMNKLNDFFDEELIRGKNDNFAKVNRNTRSVVDLRKKYQKEFLKSSNGKGTCPNCGAFTKNIVFYKSR